MTTSASEELRAYEAFVAEVAARADGTIILNHTLEHAKIILSQIFLTSQTSVKILSGCLDERAYDTKRVLNSALAFLDKDGARIEILTEKDVTASSPFFAALKERAADRVRMCTLPPTAAPKFHFAVGDGKHLRFEADKEKCEAFVQFGGEKHGPQLVDSFDKMMDYCARSH